VLVAPDAAGNAVVCSIGDVRHYVVSSSLDPSDVGHGTSSSSSDDSVICLFSEGRLSPLNS
jgi:hypothetical protein